MLPQSSHASGNWVESQFEENLKGPTYDSYGAGAVAVLTSAKLRRSSSGCTSITAGNHSKAAKSVEREHAPPSNVLSHTVLHSLTRLHKVLVYSYISATLPTNERFQRALANMHQLRQLQRYRTFVQLRTDGSITPVTDSLCTTRPLRTTPEHSIYACDFCCNVIDEEAVADSSPSTTPLSRNTSPSLPARLEYLSILANSLGVSPYCDLSHHNLASVNRRHLSTPSHPAPASTLDTPPTAHVLLCDCCLLALSRRVSAQLQDIEKYFQNECRVAAASLMRALPLAGDIYGTTVRACSISHPPSRNTSQYPHSYPSASGKNSIPDKVRGNAPRRVFLHKDIVLTVLADEDIDDTSPLTHSKSQLSDSGNTPFAEKTYFSEDLGPTGSVFLPTLQSTPLTGATAIASRLQARISANAWAAQRTGVHVPLECVLHVMGTWIWCVALWPCDNAADLSLDTPVESAGDCLRDVAIRRLVEEVYMSFGRAVGGATAQRLHESAAIHRRAAADGKTLRRARQRMQHAQTLLQHPESLTSSHSIVSSSPSFASSTPFAPVAEQCVALYTAMKSNTPTSSPIPTAEEEAMGNAKATRAIGFGYSADLIRDGSASASLGDSNITYNTPTSSASVVSVSADNMHTAGFIGDALNVTDLHSDPPPALLPVYIAGLRSALRKLSMKRAGDGRVYLVDAGDALHSDPADDETLSSAATAVQEALDRAADAMNGEETRRGRGAHDEGGDACVERGGEPGMDRKQRDGEFRGRRCIEDVVVLAEDNIDCVGDEVEQSARKYTHMYEKHHNEGDRDVEVAQYKGKMRALESIVYTYLPKYVNVVRKLRPELLFRFSQLIPDDVGIETASGTARMLVSRMSELLESHIIPAFTLKLDNMSFICDNVHDFINNMHYHGISTHHLGIISRKTHSYDIFRMCITEMIAHAAVSLWRSSMAALHRRAAAVLGVSGIMDSQLQQLLSTTPPSHCQPLDTHIGAQDGPVNEPMRDSRHKLASLYAIDAAADALSALSSPERVLRDDTYTSHSVTACSTQHLLANQRLDAAEAVDEAAAVDDADVVLALWQVNRRATADFLSQLLSVASPERPYAASQSLWSGPLRDEVLREYHFDIREEACAWPLPHPDRAVLTNPSLMPPARVAPHLHWSRRGLLRRFCELSGVVVATDVETHLCDAPVWVYADNRRMSNRGEDNDIYQGQYPPTHGQLGSVPSSQRDEGTCRPVYTTAASSTAAARLAASAVLSIAPSDITAITAVVCAASAHIELDLERMEATRDVFCTDHTLYVPLKPQSRASTPELGSIGGALGRNGCNEDASAADKVLSSSLVRTVAEKVENGKQPLNDLEGLFPRLIARISPHFDVTSHHITLLSHAIRSHTVSLSFANHYRVNIATGEHDITHLMMAGYQPLTKELVSHAIQAWNHRFSRHGGVHDGREEGHHGICPQKYPSLDAIRAFLSYFLEYEESSLITDQSVSTAAKGFQTSLISDGAVRQPQDPSPLILTNTSTFGFLLPEYTQRMASMNISQPPPCSRFRNTTPSYIGKHFSKTYFSEKSSLSLFWSHLLSRRPFLPYSSPSLALTTLHSTLADCATMLLHVSARRAALSRSAFAAREQVRVVAGRARLQQRSQRTDVGVYRDDASVRGGDVASVQGRARDVKEGAREEAGGRKNKSAVAKTDVSLESALGKTSFGVSDGYFLLSTTRKVLQFYRSSGFAVSWEISPLPSIIIASRSKMSATAYNNPQDSAIGAASASQDINTQKNSDISGNPYVLSEKVNADYLEFVNFAASVEEVRVSNHAIATMLQAETMHDKPSPYNYREDSVFTIRNLEQGIFPVTIPVSLSVSDTADPYNWLTRLGALIHTPLHSTHDANSDGLSHTGTTLPSSTPHSRTVPQSSAFSACSSTTSAWATKAFTACMRHCSAVVALVVRMMDAYIQHNLFAKNLAPLEKSEKSTSSSEKGGFPSEDVGASSVRVAMSVYEYMLAFVKHDLCMLGRLHADSSSVFQKFVHKSGEKKGINPEMLMKNLPENFSRILILFASLEYAQSGASACSTTHFSAETLPQILLSRTSDGNTHDLRLHMHNHIIFIAYLYLRLAEVIAIAVTVRSASVSLENRLLASAVLSSAAETMRSVALVQSWSHFLPVAVIKHPSQPSSGSRCASAPLAAQEESVPAEHMRLRRSLSVRDSALSSLSSAFTTKALEMNSIEYAQMLLRMANIRLPPSVHVTRDYVITETHDYDPVEFLAAISRQFSHGNAANPYSIIRKEKSNISSSSLPKPFVPSQNDSKANKKIGGKRLNSYDGDDFSSTDRQSLPFAQSSQVLGAITAGSELTIGAICLSLHQYVRDSISRLENNASSSLEGGAFTGDVRGDIADEDVYLSQAQDVLQGMGSQSATAAMCPTDPAFYAASLRFDTKQHVFSDDTAVRASRAVMGATAELTHAISYFLYENFRTESYFSELSTALLDKSALKLLHKQLLMHDFMHLSTNTPINRVDEAVRDGPAAQEEDVDRASQHPPKSSKVDSNLTLSTARALLHPTSLHQLFLLSTDPFPVKALAALVKEGSDTPDSTARDANNRILGAGDAAGEMVGAEKLSGDYHEADRAVAEEAGEEAVRMNASEVETEPRDSCVQFGGITYAADTLAAETKEMRSSRETASSGNIRQASSRVVHKNRGIIAPEYDARYLTVAHQWYVGGTHRALLRRLLELRLTWLFTRKFQDLTPEEVHEYRKDVRKQLEGRIFDAKKNVYLYYCLSRVPYFHLLVDGVQRCEGIQQWKDNFQKVLMNNYRSTK